MFKVLTTHSVGEMVAWTPLIDRINTCYETHSECLPKAGGSLPPGFRVIDVNRRCLVETNINLRFVALSYVWGLTPKSELLACSRATIDEMRKDGGLPPTKVPQTIEDATAACIQMGESYLCADMLCIIQDDPEDLQTQVKAMGEIYPSATIVLVASYGNIMESGMPGIGHPLNTVQHNADIAGLRVTNVLRETDDDPLNIWPTRGWTYQEPVLSTRRLYFMNTRAFFECKHSISHEDPFNLEEIRDELLSIRLVIAEDISCFDSFKRHLRYYSTRKPTYRSDAYNALLDFDRALLWYADMSSNAIERHETQGEVLPTWSWSSVMGLLDQVGYRATEFYGTFITWFYVSDDSSTPGSLIDVHSDPDSMPADDWTLYMALAYKENCLGGLSLDLDFELKKDILQTVQELSKIRWRDHRESRNEAISVTLAVQLSELSLSIPEVEKKGVIPTIAQSTVLKVKPRPRYGFDIIKSKGKGDIIRFLCGDAAKLREEFEDPSYNPDVELEFIAVSLSGVSIQPYSQEQLSGKNYTDVDGNRLDKVPIVNVLMVDRNGDFTYRRELGSIWLVDWAKLLREWKAVVLE
ncbi:heterokaryon incompatibility protein-domain-containing protein [Aspergillus californicus]